MDEVSKFLAKRPDYDEEHVRTLKEILTLKGIPFCDECCDWHFPTEDHSE